MADITIKTSEPKETLPLIQEAVDLEKRLINDSIIKTKTKISDFTTSLGIALQDFRDGKIEYTEEKEEALLKLEGELNLLKRLETKLGRLNSLDICA